MRAFSPPLSRGARRTARARMRPRSGSAAQTAEKAGGLWRAFRLGFRLGYEFSVAGGEVGVGEIGHLLERGPAGLGDLGQGGGALHHRGGDAEVVRILTFGLR